MATGRNGNGSRVGGLQLDPAVEEWRAEAADNPARLTRKQREDRQRTRVRYDVPAWLKEAVEEVATEQNTSASQAAALLLAWSLHHYRDRDPALLDAFFDNHEPSRTLRFEFNVKIPRSLIPDGAK